MPTSHYNKPSTTLHSQPTQPLRVPYLIPKYPKNYLWADQEEWEEEQDHKACLQEALKTLEKQGQSIVAWQPIVIFFVVLVAHGMLGCFLASHVNEVLSVLTHAMTVTMGNQ